MLRFGVEAHVNNVPRKRSPAAAGCWQHRPGPPQRKGGEIFQTSKSITAKNSEFFSRKFSSDWTGSAEVEGRLNITNFSHGIINQELHNF